MGLAAPTRRAAERRKVPAVLGHEPAGRAAVCPAAAALPLPRVRDDAARVLHDAAAAAAALARATGDVPPPSPPPPAPACAAEPLRAADVLVARAVLGPVDADDGGLRDDAAGHADDAVVCDAAGAVYAAAAAAAGACTGGTNIASRIGDTVCASRVAASTGACTCTSRLSTASRCIHTLYPYRAIFRSSDASITSYTIVSG